MWGPEPIRYTSCLAASFALAVVFTAGLRWLAPYLGMVDRPGGHKTHERPIPLMGGLAVYLAMVGAYTLTGTVDRRALWLMGGALAVLGLGLLDDRFGLRARFRLAIQVVAASAIVAAGIHFRWFSWEPLNYAVSLLWLVGLMNAMNCLDCADGIAGGTAFIAATALFFIALGYGHFAVALMAVALAGACAGFLVFNSPPASIFLGDAGSTFLGLLLGSLAMAATRRAPPLEQVWVAALPLAVPVWDIVLVHLRRYLAGTRGVRSILESTGHDHVPHRLRSAGLSPRQVALTVYVMAAVLAAPALVIVHYGAGALILAIEIALICLVVGEAPFGSLVAKLTGRWLAARAPSPEVSQVLTTKPVGGVAQFTHGGGK